MDVAIPHINIGTAQAKQKEEGATRFAHGPRQAV